MKVMLKAGIEKVKIFASVHLYSRLSHQMQQYAYKPGVLTCLSGLPCLVLVSRCSVTSDTVVLIWSLAFFSLNVPCWISTLSVF